MNNNVRSRVNACSAERAAGMDMEIDWEFYRRFLYEIWEEKSLVSVSDADSSLSELSSESLEIPLGCYSACVQYSPKYNKFSPTSRSAKKSGQNPFLPPRPSGGMAQHFQGDTTREKTSPERSGVIGTHLVDAFMAVECCSQCKEKRTTPSAVPLCRNKQSEASFSHSKGEIDAGQAYYSRGGSTCEGDYNRYAQRPSAEIAVATNLSSPFGDHLLPTRSLGNASAGNLPYRSPNHDQRVSAEACRVEESNVHKPRVGTATNLSAKGESASEGLVEAAESSFRKKKDPTLLRAEEAADSKTSAERVAFSEEEGFTTDKKVTGDTAPMVNMCLCGEEIKRLSKELQDSKNQIVGLTIQMEDQSSHLQQFIEDRRRTQQRKTSRNKSPNPTFSFPQAEFSSDQFLRSSNESVSRGGFPQYDPLSSFATPHRGGREEFNPFPHSEYSPAGNLGPHCDRGRGQGAALDRDRLPLQGLGPNLISELGRDPNVLATLKDRFLALQMQNIHLNLFLKEEEKRRHEVEEDLEKERSYIKKLEDNIQNMRSSRVVMDPLTYKEVADSYIAARKQPVRRTHTCMPCIGKSDLVCDLKGQDTLTVNYPHSSNSCPSSPLGSKIGKNKSGEGVQHQTLDDVSSLGSESPELGTSLATSPWNNVSAPQTSSLGQDEYLKLLESFDQLNTSPS